MSVKISDPLFLLSAQTGMSVGELAAKAAEGTPDVEQPQQALKIGEPIPLIFTRRRNNNGGVMVQPKMTEAYFANPIDEEVVASGSSTFRFFRQTVEIKYLLILSEGCLPQLRVKDIFHGNCRRGSFNQVCNGRAGTWTAGNDIDEHFDYVATKNAQGQWEFDLSTLANGESAKVGNTVYYKDSSGVLSYQPYREVSFPAFTGRSGSYSGLTTLSFEYTVSDSQASKIDKSISAFVRNGLQVTRLVDGVTNESDNFADLANYLMSSNNRLPSDLIDTAALTIAAKFTDANGFLFNGELKKSQNLLDWLQRTSVNFLLRTTNSGGKFGLKPRLPYNTDFTIKTTQITPEFIFTEEHVVDGGFQVEYVSLEDREPVCFVVSWRQQPEANFGIVRTIQVRYAGEAANGPFVNIDMSDYCTSENHAVKVGTYYLARRKSVTHHLRLTVRERSYNASLVVGDLVRVRLRRETSEGNAEYHDKVYEINRIEKSFQGVIEYDLTHFPIDSQGRSIVARQVDAATGAGNVIDVGRSDFDCDENGDDDDTDVPEDGGGGETPPDDGDTEIEIPQPPEDDTPYPDNPGIPDDPLDVPLDDDDLYHDGISSNPIVGDNVIVPRDSLPCDGRVCFYRVPKNGGPRELKSCVNKPISGDFTLIITTDDIDYYIVAVGQCLDPSSPDGWGDEIDLGIVGPAEPDVSQYSYVRWVGTKSKTNPENPQENFTVNETTSWLPNSSSIGLGGLYGCALGSTPIQGPSGTVFIGPCDSHRPYRSAVWAAVGVAQGGTVALGGVGGSPCPPFPAQASLQFGSQSSTNCTYLIVGKWEFSNDQSTVLVSWEGDREDASVPSGAIPGNNTYTC